MHPSEHRFDSSAPSRRCFLQTLGALGVGGGLFPGSLWAVSDGAREITVDAIKAAEELAGLSFTDADRALMLQALREARAGFEAMRAVEVDIEMPPAFLFDPFLAAGEKAAGVVQRSTRPAFGPDVETRPTKDVDLAFAPLAVLAALLRRKAVTSVELTKIFLARIASHDASLHAVVTTLAEAALAEAAERDRELEKGVDRGPLHGIPYGAKDILAARGAPTTWGAKPTKDQVRDYDAAVVEKLRESGAVLIAKLTTGALAMGDRWFGGMTRNPWRLEEGSSGSSAGPAAATVAGLVPFAIGSETLGSIVSPSLRSGATGHRPTFGRVSRYGAMALSWTMDKLGPIARSAADCALVFAAIHGRDRRDPSSRSASFDAGGMPAGSLKIAYCPESFPKDSESWREIVADLQAANHGVAPAAVALPKLPTAGLMTILEAESAAAFDDFVRAGRERELDDQKENDWPNSFRAGRFIPAVEYIRAQRIRTLLCRELAKLFADIDALVLPPYYGSMLLVTNLTGHPAVTLPTGFRKNGTPIGLTMIGRLDGDDRLLAAAALYQQKTGHHRKRPPAFS